MSRPLSVAFLWHMHQPFYKEADTGLYHLPWVYLHAMKDYTDMAAILRQTPGARATINLVPSLMVQIEDYAAHLRRWLDGGQQRLPDPLLEALSCEHPGATAHSRRLLLDRCFRLNHERNLHRYPDYARLFAIAEHARGLDAVDYLGDAYFGDLVTWYHLAWLAETVRNEHFVARRLIEKGRGFSHQDRRDLLTVIAALLDDIAKAHRELAASGKAELTTTPYAHPILPLLLDFNTARETVPDALLPESPYPDGEARAREHVDLAIARHERDFGARPRGCWPAEGAVSPTALTLLAEAGFRWCATGESVLHHSLQYNLREQHGGRELYQPWIFGESGREIAVFFRDDRLSDLIGFEYARWRTEDAIANFMHELAGIRHRTQGMEAPIVAIIMDGENAWEHYHENGIPFLSGLYRAIAEHPDYELTTFSNYLERHPATARLPRLVSGSWVYGNLATWIGDPAKTRGWELLIEAKHAFDRNIDRLSPEQQEAAREQLRICEGSDWCWWFGDYNPSDAVRDFDQLYRTHLRKLWHLLGELPPADLDAPISAGGGDAEAGGVMRRGRAE
ncbi:MAG: glycoside hydrolase family 57 protein [Mariprofundaceae bacterium]